MSTKEVLIIGSGIGGSALGALLANDGRFNVTLVEKSDLIGGRYASFEKDAFKLDIGCHTIANAEKGKLASVLEKCGHADYVKWISTKQRYPVINFKGEFINFPSEIHKLGFTEEEIFKFFTFTGDIQKFLPEDYEKYSTTSTLDFLNKYIDHDIARSIVSFYTTTFFASTISEVPISEYARAQNEVWLNQSVGYVEGGTGSIPKAYCRIIEEAGGKILTGCPVQNIRIENGKATGVVLEGGEHLEADIVVSNAGIKQTVMYLVGDEHYSQEFLLKVKSYKYSDFKVPVIKIALDQPIAKEDVIFYIGHENLVEVDEQIMKNGELPKDVPHMTVSVMSNLQLDAAPPGKQLITLGAPIKLPFDAGKQVWQDWEAAMLQTLEIIYPNLRSHILWTVGTSPADLNNLVGKDGNVVGIAQTMNQVGENRPSFIDPHIQNLYHSGADTGLHGIGGELAADSALRLFEYLIG